MAETPYTEEDIMAYLDGQMSDADCARFEGQMAYDPALAAAVERMVANDNLLRDGFAAPMAEGVGDDVLARFGLVQGAAPVTDNVVAFPQRTSVEPERVAANDDPAPWRRFQWPALGGGLAAALALVALMQGGQSDFGRAMDSTPSRQIAALDDGATVQPVLSFQAGDGRFCREFVRTSGGTSTDGIACKSGKDWKIEAEVKGAPALSNGQQIEVAGGADGKGLSDAYARLGAGDPLPVEEEKALIAKKWAASKK